MCLTWESPGTPEWALRDSCPAPGDNWVPCPPGWILLDQGALEKLSLSQGPWACQMQIPSSHQGPQRLEKILGDSSFSSLLTLSISYSPTFLIFYERMSDYLFCSFLESMNLEQIEGFSLFISTLVTLRTLCGQVCVHSPCSILYLWTQRRAMI